MSRVSLESPEKDEDSAERRRTLRTDLIVRVDYSTIDEMFSEFTRDINEGGLFIETEKPQPSGTEVTMEFNLPGSQGTVSTIGRVVHVTSGDHESPSGMGIEFEELSTEDRSRIDALIRSLRSQSPQD
jgi:uncharacterized protein (TIGR02266 family)